MSEPYRNDVEALAARHAALAAEVAEKTRARDEAARMLAEARARQHAEARAAEASRPRHQRGVVIAVAAVALAVIALAIWAGSHRKSDRERTMGRATEQLAAFTDEMCRCPDATCAQAVMDRLGQWSRELSRELPPSNDPIDSELAARISKITDRMSTCAQQAFGAREKYGQQAGGVAERPLD